jgi:initiation factor 1A
MPKNVLGGKGNKKARNSDIKPELPDVEPGQYFGRVLRCLGSKNFLIYRNDNKQVFCKVRGSLRRRVWIKVGDVVLLSMRVELADTDNKTFGSLERGDILASIDSTLYGKLKKMDDFNQRLLLNLESLTSDDGKMKALPVMTGGGAGGYDEDDDIFDRGEESDEPDDGEESDESSDSHDSRKKDRRIVAGRARKELTNDEIDKI